MTPAENAPRPHLGPRARRRAAIAVAVVVVAAVLAVVGFIAAERARPISDDAQRTALLTATSDAVTALTNFAPDSGAQARREVAAQLTAPLESVYEVSGADVILPGAVEAGVTMTSRVVGTGVDSYGDDIARVLVFIDQTVTTPPSDGATSDNQTERNGERTSIARWASMRNVEGHWRLADLDPVGDVTR
ncbi:hypothetical protein VZC37_12340 [Gordonia sp. LSe1-13]|uniref:Mce-associated membrane protein n=1 Tax=Gordonia sesuvii TaxID=3116777 RepID=A0ABU7ME88_9ACTN|nr:hypothetical protein [Gordonia sp. LSe1-13]